MNKLVQSFKDKRLRYGAFSTITAVFVIAILMVINLLAGQFDVSFDLTKDRMYSLSERTKTALAEVDEDVTIYWLLKTGMTDQYLDIMRELLEEYPRINGHIRLEYKDPYLYPQFVEQYRTEDQDIPTGSVIVEGSNQFKVISVNELVTQEVDYQTWQTYISSVDLEPQVTNAIRYVLGGEVQTVYVLNGHGEQVLADSLKSRITMANYELKELNLFNMGAVPEDCDLLFITTPERDWSAETVGSVRSYLENDGRAVFFIDFTNTEYPNMESVLSVFGVELVHGLVFEGDPNHYFQGSPINLVPLYAQHEITQMSSGKDYVNIVPMTMAIKETDIKMQSTKVYPLMETSGSAYIKTNMDSQSINKEPEDEGGPFVISAAIEDNTYTDVPHTTKLVVTATSTILNDTVNSYVMGANYDYVMNCINWTQDKMDDIYISPKTSTDNNLLMTAGQAFTIVGVSLIIPVAVLLIGVVVWFRRRNS